MSEERDQDAPGRREGRKSPEAFRTISEVAEELGLPQHVLRFWETKFPQIRPLKRGGGRRYYRPEDIAVLKAVQGLLYDSGYTIKGVQKLIRTTGIKSLLVNGEMPPVEERLPAGNPASAEPAAPSSLGAVLGPLIRDLEILRDRLKGDD